MAREGGFKMATYKACMVIAAEDEQQPTPTRWPHTKLV